MPEKEYRIAKVASELNHSFQVLVDHLNKQGFGVESKPTAKINEEMYQALLREFRADKELKDEANKLKVRREEKPVLPAAKLTKGLPKKEELEEMPVVEEVEVIKPEPEPVVVEAPVVEVEKSVEAPVLEKKEEEEDGKTVLKGPKILGKIEIPDKKKKKEEREPEKRKEEPKKEEIKEAPVVKKEEPAKEEKKEKKEEKVEKVEKSEVPVVAEVKEKKEELAELKVEAVESDTEVVSGEDETEKIETKFEKLSGPKVLGKIEIKTEAKSGIKKLAEEARDEEREKRKRKRKKVTAEKIQINEKVKEQEKTQPNNNRPATTDKPAVNQRDVQNKVKSTMGRVGGAGQNKGFKQKLKKQQREKTEFRRMEEAERRDKESKILKVTEFLSANELASLMDAPVNKVIQVCFNLGLMVSINQRLDAETITVLADEFGYAVEFQDAEAQLDVEEVEDAAEDLEDRPPIVTVMGHVDHGKTSLLDYVRKTNVIAGEAGGITQHIGAYEVTLPDQRKITFLDTPGHEAFTAMRARGAKVTDIAIIVVAADDSVMPQTREAIAHAQAAGVPMVFAINKIDKDGANPDKIREELSGMNILVEEWGGKFQCQEISAKKGLNIDKLLDKVLLEAEFLQLKANPNRAAKGTVIEASLEKGRGIVASVLVQNGTLSIGDHLVAGPYYAKVKALFNERGAKITEAPPSTPVKMLGFSDSPAAGDVFLVMEDEDSAKDLANKRYQLVREQGMRTKKHITLDEIGRRLAVGNFKELNLIVKGDVDGSVEALSDALLKLSTEEIQINVIHSGVGQITESDVLLASASDAIIVGFQVRPSAKAKALAENEEIDIRAYSVIYKAIEEIRSAMEGMLSPEVIEKITGNVEVRDVFRISKVGTIAGCYVLDGSIERKSKVRIIRDGVVLHSGELLSLKRYKDDVKEVNKGYECGLQISGYNDIEVGDHIEVYKEEQVQRKLD